MLWIDRLRTDNSLRKLIHSDSTEELVHIEEVLSNVERGGTLVGEQNLNILEKNIGTYGDDTYSNEDTYEVGDIVIYQGLLYKCILKIDEPEDFNSSHWQNFNLLEEKASVDEIEKVNLTLQDIQDYIDSQIGNLDTTKQNKFTRAVDTNGWTVLNFGTHKEFLKKVNVDQTLSGNSWTRFTISNLPTELSRIGDCILTCSGLVHDAAIAANIGCVDDSSTTIAMSCQNKYDQPVPVWCRVHLRILKLM